MYTLPPLKYAYEALEPIIDSATMHLHHEKHHQTYINNLNDALKAFPDLAKFAIEDLMSLPEAEIPTEIRKVVRNMGGGHYNHELFWQVMAPVTQAAASKAENNQLQQAIVAQFGSVEKFEAQFSDVALKQFGSGWAFLVVDESKKLEIIGLPNQDVPLQNGQKALMNLDVWEHAYYLKYQNRRADYIKAFWQVVDWQFVNQRFLGMLK